MIAAGQSSSFALHPTVLWNGPMCNTRQGKSSGDFLGKSHSSGTKFISSEQRHTLAEDLYCNFFRDLRREPGNPSLPRQPKSSLSRSLLVGQRKNSRALYPKPISRPSTSALKSHQEQNAKKNNTKQKSKPPSKPLFFG